MRPRFTSFTSSRSIPPNQLAPKAVDDNALSRPSELRRSTTAYPRETPNWSFGNGNADATGPLRRANSSNAAGAPLRQKILDRDRDRSVLPVTNSRFGSHFGSKIGATALVDGLDGSSNSVPEEDEDDESGDDRSWGLEKGMSLFEVSAKDDYGEFLAQ